MTASCKRNEKGWRIPKFGTKSQQIYDLMMAGFTSNEIIDLFQEDRIKTGIRVIIHQIKSPEKHAAKNKKWRDKNPSRVEAIRKKNKPKSMVYSAYVKKLVRVLGISHTEAVEIAKKELEKQKCASERATASASQSATSQT